MAKATKEQVLEWFEEGISGSFDYMLIVSIHDEDHPIFVMEDETELKNSWKDSTQELYHLVDDFSFSFEMNRLARSQNHIFQGPIIN